MPWYRYTPYIITENGEGEGPQKTFYAPNDIEAWKHVDIENSGNGRPLLLSECLERGRITTKTTKRRVFVAAHQVSRNK